MVTTQEKSIEYIKQQVNKRDCRSDKYEVKKFEITEVYHGILSIFVETGLKDDEGTLAQIFARTRRQIFVGKRGGLSAINERGFKVTGAKVWYIYV